MKPAASPTSTTCSGALLGPSRKPCGGLLRPLLPDLHALLEHLGALLERSLRLLRLLLRLRGHDHLEEVVTRAMQMPSASAPPKTATGWLRTRLRQSSVSLTLVRRSATDCSISWRARSMPARMASGSLDVLRHVCLLQGQVRVGKLAVCLDGRVRLVQRREPRLVALHLFAHRRQLAQPRRRQTSAGTPPSDSAEPEVHERHDAERSPGRSHCASRSRKPSSASGSRPRAAEPPPRQRRGPAPWRAGLPSLRRGRARGARG